MEFNGALDNYLTSGLDDQSRLEDQCEELRQHLDSHEDAAYDFLASKHKAPNFDFWFDGLDDPIEHILVFWAEDAIEYFKL